MKTWSEFKSERLNRGVALANEAVLPTNKHHGFLGTAGPKSHEMIDKAVAHVKKAAAKHPHFKMSDQTISHYLDSAGGRHLADQMNYNAHPDEIHRSLVRSIKTFSKSYDPNMFESFMDDGSELNETEHPRVFQHTPSKPGIKPKTMVQTDKLKLPFRNHTAAAAWMKKAGHTHYHDGETTDHPVKKLHESDPHMAKVYANAFSTAGRAAAAKRAAADAKARQEYLDKKSGKVDAPKAMATPTAHDAPKKAGILHNNAAKAKEHWTSVRKLLDKPLLAKIASEKLHPHTDDSRLHADLAHFSKFSPNVDVRPLVKKHLERIRKQG